MTDPIPTPRPSRRRRSFAAWTLPTVAVALVLGACAPAASGVLSPPTFRLVSEASGLTRLDLPGFGAGGATFRLVVEAHNPNPVPLRIAGLDGDVFLAGARVAAATFPEGVALSPRGSSRVTLDVTVGADRLPELLVPLTDVLAGRPVEYRIDGALAVEVLGAVQRFPSVTLARGTIAQDIALAAPTVALDAAASGVRSVSFDGVTIDLALRVRNPNLVGVVLRAPDARLRIGGRDVAIVQLVAGRVAAHSETTVVQRVVVNPVQLGAAVVTQLQDLAAGRPASVDVAIVGSWELEVPGLRSVGYDAGELVRGRLD
jgi:LEA14-like dessication related protein